jgi:hypothetical protein
MESQTDEESKRSWSSGGRQARTWPLNIPKSTDRAFAQARATDLPGFFRREIVAHPRVAKAAAARQALAEPKFDACASTLVP